jgi:predicted deacylase
MVTHRTIHRTTHLNVDELPTGQISRVYIEIVADGLASDVLIPILVARGRKPGPVFGVTAAVHGNELNGIRVIHDFFAELDVAHLRGTLCGVVCVNVPGLHAHEREIYRSFDLNHTFPGSPTGNVAQLYANRLLDRIVDRFDYLVDLHTASFGRINSLYVRADLENEKTRQMATRLRPQIIVHNPASDYTLRGAAMDRGIPAITVEVGDPQRFQKKYVKSTRLGLRDILGDADMLPRKKRKDAPTPILCSRSYWMFTDRGGLLEVLPPVATRVAEGEVIARVRDAFGDTIREYQAPHDGVVIGKSNNPISPTGSRILHIGREMNGDRPSGPGSPGESA